MKPLILLDIDGVLNPMTRVLGRGDPPELVLSDIRVALVRRLASWGRIAWVSTWPTEQTAGLESQLQLEVEPLRVPLPTRARGESDAATPKLWPVNRWLDRMAILGEDVWDSVVWIDDIIGPDARQWAQNHHQPVLLLKPSSAQGLVEDHLVSVKIFVDGGTSV